MLPVDGGHLAGNPAASNGFEEVFKRARAG
jgi:hypothetical protein